MKQIKRRLEISYKWWRNDKENINKEHIEALEDRAMEIIQRAMRDGHIEGDMFEYDECNWNYRGYWKIEKH